MESIDPQEMVEFPRVHFYTPTSKNKIAHTTLATLAIPTTGLIRYEWHIAFCNILIPTCFAVRTTPVKLKTVNPIGFHVAEARNLCVEFFIKHTSDEGLFFVDHDVLLHPLTYAHMLEHMTTKKYPIVSGLYYTKGNPSYPLVYRGRGTGPYTNFSVNDLVTVDGVPMGCTIIHRSILQYLYDTSPEAFTHDYQKVKEVFRSPRDIYLEPESMTPSSLVGTEDLFLCAKIINEGILEKTGWESLKDEKYPFLCDTRIFCGHITQEGTIYPLGSTIFNKIV